MASSFLLAWIFVQVVKWDPFPVIALLLHTTAVSHVWLVDI